MIFVDAVRDNEYKNFQPGDKVRVNNKLPKRQEVIVDGVVVNIEIPEVAMGLEGKVVTVKEIESYWSSILKRPVFTIEEFNDLYLCDLFCAPVNSIKALLTVEGGINV